FPLRRAFALLNLSWEPIWRLGGGRWQDLYRLASRQLETLQGLSKEGESESDDEEAKHLSRSIHETATTQDKIRKEFAAYCRMRGSNAQNVPLSILLCEPGSIPEKSQHKPLSSRDVESSDLFISNYECLQQKIAQTCAAALKYLQP